VGSPTRGTARQPDRYLVNDFGDPGQHSCGSLRFANVSAVALRSHDLRCRRSSLLRWSHDSRQPANEVARCSLSWMGRVGSGVRFPPARAGGFVPGSPRAVAGGSAVAITIGGLSRQHAIQSELIGSRSNIQLNSRKIAPVRGYAYNPGCPNLASGRDNHKVLQKSHVHKPNPCPLCGQPKGERTQ
jgi:hypothetical protein